jgi:hypothetical protein
MTIKEQFPRLKGWWEMCMETLNDDGFQDHEFVLIYGLESYVFNVVRKRFLEQEYLDAHDFFCIVIWKANRAKSKIAKKIISTSNCNNLNQAVIELTKFIQKEIDHKSKLKLLMKKYKFQLPMASAILTALYPDDFTVYDIRVCDVLEAHHSLKHISNFEKVWEGYQLYIDDVVKSAPDGLLLRDKDRYLWGKSFALQLQNDIKSSFDNL